MREQSWGLVIAVAATLVLLVFTGYQLLQRDEPEEAPAEPPPAADIGEPAPPPEPRYPIEEPEPAPAAAGEQATEEAPAEPARPPLPPLEESDDAFTGTVDELLPEPEQVSGLELRDRLIRKLVATVDGLEREALPERVRPLEPVPGSFRVSGKVDGDLYILSPANYERYDALVNAAAEIDLSAAADVYRRYYPLFQQGWAELGYPDSYFNDRLVVVIDHLLATPDVADPVRLVRPHVLYRYENPVLEGLSSGQKLLIRMGPENRATVKTLLRQFRGEITGMTETDDEG